MGVEESEFELADQLHEEFPIEQIPIGTDPTDGMPVPIMGDPRDALAVPFTYDTQLCIEDDRVYVELFQQELIERSNWDNVPHLQRRSRYGSNGEENARTEYKPEEVEHLWGVHIVKKDDTYIPVRPTRERCKFYRRQVFSNDNQPDVTQPGHQLVFRVCAARKSNGGACMSLRDEGIYQCDFRDPPDERTAAVQDAKDRSKLVSRPDLLLLPLFNMAGDAVQQERKPS